MKKILTLLLITSVLALPSMAQDAVTSFFDKYGGDEEFTEVTVSSRMFGLFTDMEVDNKKTKKFWKP